MAFLVLRYFILTVCVLFVAPALHPEQEVDPELVRQAREILKSVPLIDGHNDVPWTVRENFQSDFSQSDLRSNTALLKPAMHTDIARLRQGGVGAQFWSVYVPANEEYQGFKAVQTVLEQIDLVHQINERYADVFEMALTAADIRRIHSSGKIASLIGVEGGHCINNSLAVLRELYRCGARYMTLTHSKNTAWADSSTDEPKNNGLSKFGEEVVREMNWLGMLVDLSHVSPDTMNDALDTTKAPVIFSHSTARAIGGHQRNVPDEVLKRLPKNGGIVMVDFVPSFVSEEAREYAALRKGEEERLKVFHPDDPDEVKKRLELWEKKNPRPPVTVQQVADHVDHIRKQAGIDHVGIGSDYDGITNTPVGLEDVSKFPSLLAELLRRGYTIEDVSKISGLNALRVMEKVEAVAREMQKQRPANPALFEPRPPKKDEY